MASGGNDNQLLIWSLHRPTPVQTYAQHTAAVKVSCKAVFIDNFYRIKCVCIANTHTLQALAWCPHQHGLLVSGGGTADRTLRFWNTLTGQSMHCIDTGSQVCNVIWSKHTKELVSTHGYSQNQIVVWTYPSFEQVAKLTGHTSRVLYLVSRQFSDL
jgi:cell division cycle 20-like protein 1 (cofactor of APC complex)